MKVRAETMAGIWLQELIQRPWRVAARWLAPHGLLSQQSRTTHGCSTLHSELDPPTSVMKQDSTPYTCLQTNWWRHFLSQDSFFSGVSRFVWSCQKTKRQQQNPIITRDSQSFPPEKKVRVNFLLKKKKRWEKISKPIILINSLHGPWEVCKGSPGTMIQKEITLFFKGEIALNRPSSMNWRATVPTLLDCVLTSTELRKDHSPMPHIELRSTFPNCVACLVDVLPSPLKKTCSLFPLGISLQRRFWSILRAVWSPESAIPAKRTGETEESDWQG